MSKILVIFVHPYPALSKINVPLKNRIERVDNVSVRDLYALYPDFNINVSEERIILNEHDAIVFQHPLFWYSAPALLKEWQDTVLEVNWAYGARQALRGKKLISVVTAGGGFDSYTKKGHNHYTMKEILVPFEQLANFCGMSYLDPLVFYDVSQYTYEDIQTHAQTYQEYLERILENLQHYDI